MRERDIVLDERDTMGRKQGPVPCDHPGCFSHVTHPCEGCGRIWGHGLPGEDPGEMVSPSAHGPVRFADDAIGPLIWRESNED